MLPELQRASVTRMDISTTFLPFSLLFCVFPDHFSSISLNSRLFFLVLDYCVHVLLCEFLSGESPFLVMEVFEYMMVWVLGSVMYEYCCDVLFYLIL